MKDDPCPRCKGTGRLIGKRGRKSAIDETLLARLVAKGLTKIEIAARLGITRQAVYGAIKRLDK